MSAQEQKNVPVISRKNFRREKKIKKKRKFQLWQRKKRQLADFFKQFAHHFKMVRFEFKNIIFLA